MKCFNFIIISVVLLLNLSCSNQVSNGIKQYQSKLAKEWTNPETTPLKEDEVANFKGITFFPINRTYIVNAEFIPIQDGKTIPFPTSANKIKYYKEYGKLNFSINQKNLELTVYQSDPPIEGYESSLFLPFMDETNGISSYGGGRYLDFDIQDIKNNQLKIDFNKAYNPYCAYSKYYNCPIPPANNFLSIEILAGVSYID